MASHRSDLLQSLYQSLRRQLLRRNHTLAANWASQSLTPPPPALGGPTADTKATFHIELSGRHRRKLLRALHLSGLRH